MTISSGMFDLRGGACIDRAGADPPYDRLGHDIPSSAPDPSRARSSPGRQPSLPLLALAYDGHGHQGVGGRPPEASREDRNRGRPAQSADPRHRSSAVGRRVSLRDRSARPRHARAIRPWHAGRLDRASFVCALLVLRPRPHGICRRGRVRDRSGESDLRAADGLDTVLGGRRDQRTRALLEIPQLPGRGRQHQSLPLGHPDRRRRVPQQSSRLPDIGEAVERLVRVRHRLDVHPPARNPRPRPGEKDRAHARFSPPQDAVRRGRRPGRHHAPVLRARAIHPFGQRCLPGRRSPGSRGTPPPRAERGSTRSPRGICFAGCVYTPGTGERAAR